MSRFQEQRFNWMALPRDQVEVGDWYANGGTVTEVIVGPHDAPEEWEAVKPGEVLIRCGQSFSSKGRNDGRMIIVGRRP